MCRPARAPAPPSAWRATAFSTPVSAASDSDAVRLIRECFLAFRDLAPIAEPDETGPSTGTEHAARSFFLLSVCGVLCSRCAAFASTFFVSVP